MRKNQTVFVAEDDTATRECLVAMLELDGFRVETAPDGWRALDAMTERRPDAVVLDLMMPKMDGITVLEELRRRAPTRDLPVLILTARSDELARWLTSEFDDTEFMTKPIDPLDLSTALRRLLETPSQSRRERDN